MEPSCTINTMANWQIQKLRPNGSQDKDTISGVDTKSKPQGPDGIYHYKPPWNAAELSELRPATSQSNRSFRTMPDKIFHHLG